MAVFFWKYRGFYKIESCVFIEAMLAGIVVILGARWHYLMKAFLRYCHVCIVSVAIKGSFRRCGCREVEKA